MTLIFDITPDLQPKAPLLELQYDRIFPWLVDHGRLNFSFTKESQELSEVASNQFKKLPDYIQNQYQDINESITFFDCELILSALLKRDKASEKTIFGNYKDPLVKSWDDLLKKLKKNNIHIGQATNMISRLIQQDIPFARKSIQKCLFEIESLQRKRTEQLQSAAGFMKEYEMQCSSLGVRAASNSEQIRTQLLQQVPQMQGILARAIQQISQSQKLKDATILYVKFANSIVEHDKLERVHKIPLCTLRRAQSISNEVLSQITSSQTALPSNITNQAEVNEKQSNDVKQQADNDKQNKNKENDDDLIIEDEGIQEVNDSEDNSIQDIKKEDKSNTDQQFVDQLSQPELRKSLLRDLNELHYFLSQRISESTSSLSSQSNFSSLFSSKLTQRNSRITSENNQQSEDDTQIEIDEDSAWRSYTLDSSDIALSLSVLNEMQRSVQRAVDALSERRLVQLSLMYNSKRYVSRLIQQLQLRKEGSLRVQQLAAKTDGIINNMQNTLKQKKDVLNSIIERTKSISSNLEESINKLPNMEKRLAILGIPQRQRD